MRDLDDDVRWPEATRRAVERDDRTLRSERALPGARRRERLEHEGRTYGLRGSETQVLRTLGTFGPTRVEDLDMARRGDVRSLVGQGLVERTSGTERDRRERREIVALSPTGRRLLEEAGRDEGPYRAGFGRRRELAHDALIYRAYRDAAHTIERSGGRVERVALDSALKQAVYAKAGPDERDIDAEALRHARAAALDLRIDDGHVQFPDLQITYFDRDGHEQRMSVDVVTDSYKAHHIGAKTRAGFHLFRAPRNAKARGSMQHERDARDLFER